MDDGILSDLSVCHATIAALVVRLGGDVTITARELYDATGGTLDECVDNGIILLEANING